MDYASAFSDEEVSKQGTKSNRHGVNEGAGLLVVQSTPDLEVIGYLI